MNQSSSTVSAEPNTYWLSIQLNENEAVSWSVENTTVYVQQIVGDLVVATENTKVAAIDDKVLPVTSLPIGLEWKRWAFEKEFHEVRFWPILPNKPLVVKTRIPIIIPPKSSIELYINLPIWLEISVMQEGKNSVLDVIETSKLSNTWYGTHFEGELGFALKSRARRSLEDLDTEPLRAVCLFKVSNRSNDSIPVEKIRIHSEHLNLYQAQERLWTSSVKVSIRDREEGAEVQYEPSAPPIISGATLIRGSKKAHHRYTLLDKLIFRPFGLDG